MLDFIAVSKAYGSHILLDDAGLRINDQDRIGLVGANGSGKTTLFRLIMDEESTDSGTIQRKKGLRIGFLPQEIDSLKEGDVLGEVLGGRPQFHRVHRKLECLEQELARSPSEELEKDKAYLLLQYEELGGEGVLAEANELLGGLGFKPEDVYRPLSTFSGGWHMRVRLARLLLGRPELLLLDEPTNHLDLPSMIWFEGYLRRFNGAFVVVSHDRVFLNRTVERIVELDRGMLGTYNGDYDLYRKKKAEAVEHQEKAFRSQQSRVREIEDFIARNRVRKDRARQVQSRMKMLERMEMLESPSAESAGIGFEFPQPERAGAKILECKSLGKSYGEKEVFSDLDLTVNRGDKIALIGVNGMGKSTLLKIIAGQLEYERGTCRTGHRVEVGYFAQHQLEALDPGRSVWEEILSCARDETVSQLRSLLGAFLFSGEDVEKRVAVLSGGEKSRLALAKLLLRPANFLLMDEPTNHLDIHSREVLEGALRRYEGTLLFASHDRRFIDAVANRVVEMEWGVLRDYIGDYSYYKWKKRQEEEQVREENAEQDPASPEGAPDTGRRNERQERKRREAELRQALHSELKELRREVETLEAAVSTDEASVNRLEQELADPTLYSGNSSEVEKKSTRLAAARRALETHMERWEEAGLELEQREAEIRARFEG